MDTILLTSSNFYGEKKMCKCWLWFSEICLYNLSNFVWHGLNPTHASGFEAMKCGIGPKVTFHKGGNVERSDVTPIIFDHFPYSFWTFMFLFYLDFYFPLLSLDFISLWIFISLFSLDFGIQSRSNFGLQKKSLLWAYIFW